MLKGASYFVILHYQFFVAKILNAVQKKLAAGPQNALKTSMEFLALVIYLLLLIFVQEVKKTILKGDKGLIFCTGRENNLKRRQHTNIFYYYRFGVGL